LQSGENGGENHKNQTTGESEDYADPTSAATTERAGPLGS
jgi:hypothetical protein